MSEDSKKNGKFKVQRIFEYIRELTKIRTPPVSNLESYDWILKFSSLPKHPLASTFAINTEADDYDGVIFKIQRPNETPCPQPPREILEWLNNGWDKVAIDASHLDSKNILINGKTITERFDESAHRVNEYRKWIVERQNWFDAEKPIREVSAVFSDFFKLQARIQRESEKYQLFLADGHLVWNSAKSEVSHPVLLKKVELEFNPSVPEFIIRETDDESELYSALLRFHELSGIGISDCKKKLAELTPHPLGNGKATEFLKFLVQRLFVDGKYFEIKPDNVSGESIVYRDTVIFLGNHDQGFAEALDKLVENIPQMEISDVLYRIAGAPQETEVNINSNGSSIENNELNTTRFEEVDFLLTKPANKEQERVLTRLEKNGAVLVQGPPGTGKSHTIANIVGHLLANGKTVLISSHTSKALRVVREKVAKPLQPLCVAVLENDTEGKAQLEQSVNGIVSYLSRTNDAEITQEIQSLSERRINLQTRLKKLEAEALDVRKSEYQDIVVAGESISPSEAARKVSELSDEYGWIPGPVKEGTPLPLSESDLIWLYSSNGLISRGEEQCFEEGLTDPKLLLPIEEFKSLVKDVQAIDFNQAQMFSELWLGSHQNIDQLKVAQNKLTEALIAVESNEWISKVLEDVQLGPNQSGPWINLVKQIEKTFELIGQRAELILKYGPKIRAIDDQNLFSASIQVVEHLRSGKRISFFSTVFKSSWKKLVRDSTVDSGPPSALEHFESLLALFETTKLRSELLKRWERQVQAIGGPSLNKDEPEKHAYSFIAGLNFSLEWKEKGWREIESILQKSGFDIQRAEHLTNNTSSSSRYLDHFKNLVRNIILPAIQNRIALLRYLSLENRRSAVLASTSNMAKPSNRSEYLSVLESAISENDCQAYANSYERLHEIIYKKETYEKRKFLIEKVADYAVAWANEITNRSGIHANTTVKNDVNLAWKIRQWDQIIQARLAKDYSKIQREILKAKSDLQDINAQYVEKLAWKNQIARTGLQERQALTGWQQIQNRITKSGKGKRDAYLRREARKNLRNCKNAVPVWIMPFSKVVEEFDLTTTKFDVLILDEASQSDVVSLAAFAIAKNVVVVGDNEQVTPYAVGQDLGQTQTLIDELLSGIPNRMLYDGKTSVYDLAEQSFGETIRLVEHFRCVPDIIQFSNHLSYNGEIKPLRESASSKFKESIVLHRVMGSRGEGKTNRIEAYEVASIVKAMTESTEYAESSIGVISLLGQEQALLIDSILQKNLDPAKYSKHKIVCGNASQFQGDERDVMLLSMVDSCDDPPLSIRQSDDVKKTYNVACSRARDQMWVVHSLNPSTDLKPGDLRLRLINHALNPSAISQEIEAVAKKAESPFERLVIERLVRAGYKLQTQWEVGAYRIDIVVEGKDARVAIECDGDRYHPPEKLADDIQRQMVLERLGWRFIRVRGSEFFRNPDGAMKRIFDELDDYEIDKTFANIESMNTDESNRNQTLRLSILRRSQEIQKEWKRLESNENER